MWCTVTPKHEQRGASANPAQSHFLTDACTQVWMHAPTGAAPCATPMRGTVHCTRAPQACMQGTVRGLVRRRVQDTVRRWHAARCAPQVLRKATAQGGAWKHARQVQCPSALHRAAHRAPQPVRMESCAAVCRALFAQRAAHHAAQALRTARGMARCIA